MRLAVAAALAGAADTGAFLARRPELFRESPQRAGGSVAMLGLWLVTARAAAAEHPGSAAAAAAFGLAAANGALLAAHLRAGIASPRIWAGGVLSAAVLADVLRRR